MLDCEYTAGKTICCCETDGRTTCKYKSPTPVPLPETPGSVPSAFKTTTPAMDELTARARKMMPDAKPAHKEWVQFDSAGAYKVGAGGQKFRTHTTGASRDLDDGKPDFEAMLSPLVMDCYGAYMTRKRRMVDGTLREADNWKKGMPLDWFIKSGWRHMVDWWKHHRREGKTTETLEDTLCALLFNVSGFLHEHLKAQRK